MIAHLQGHGNALEPVSWKGRRAEWIALVCLDGGIFARARCMSFLGCHTEKVHHAFDALISHGVAVERNPPGIIGIGGVCPMHGCALYRAFGAKDILRCWITSKEVLMRCLLLLEHVLEHPRLPWLPTEPEKVRAFKALGIERRLLLQRIYPGAAGNTRRYFPIKLPVALDAERPFFVHVDPDYETAPALRSWGVAHCGLWKVLRQCGRSFCVFWQADCWGRVVASGD